MHFLPKPEIKTSMCLICTTCIVIISYAIIIAKYTTFLWTNAACHFSHLRSFESKSRDINGKCCPTSVNEILSYGN